MKLVLLAAALLSATSSLAHGPVPTFNDFLTRSLGNGTFDERSGVFTAHDAQAFDERSVFDASVGIMIERDMLPGGAGAREKRSIGSEPKTTRDVLRREVELDLNERGEISWPANFDDVSRLAKRAKRKVVKKTSRKFSASSSTVSVASRSPADPFFRRRVHHLVHWQGPVRFVSCSMAILALAPRRSLNPFC